MIGVIQTPFNTVNDLMVVRGFNLEGIISKLGLAASAVSILGSVYIYFVQADEMLGVFVGLWAPTLILFSQEIEKLME
jgi:hypothetical protein